jgi:C4-dicarboxylate-specific signal transduction histidine kinase
MEERGEDASNGIAGDVAVTHAAMRVDDVSADPRYEPGVDAVSGAPVRALISVPLIAHGERLGVLQAVRGPLRRPFAPAEHALLEMVAPHVAIAVSHALTMKWMREAREAAAAATADLELKIRQRTALLIKAKREWESTVDAISEPLALLKDMSVARANLAYGKQAGVEIRSVPGRKCYELLAHRRSPCPGCPVVEARGGREPAQAELRMGELHVQVFTFPTGDEDESVVVHYRDVTEQRRLEARLRHTERLASLGQLASGAAHEINNPLGFVISNLRSIGSMLESRNGRTQAEVAADLREAVADALVGAERVAAIVRALRLMARQHVGKTETVQLKESAVRVLAPLLETHAAVVTDFSVDAKARVAPLLLDQALGNLLTNAKQAVKPGQRILISTGVDGDDAWLRVADEGAGIAPADLPRVFEPFFTTRGVGGGVGLGLTAAWSIVSSFGGRIEVESALGKGSTFTIHLPRVLHAEQPSLALPA